MTDVLLHVVVSRDDGQRDADEENKIGDEVFDQVIGHAGGWQNEVEEKVNPKLQNPGGT